MKSMPPLFAMAALFAPAFPAHAGVVFYDSFETPAVTGRIPKKAGGDLAKADPSRPGVAPAWSRFEDQPNLGEEGGSVIAGLTNQVARTGTQALFIEATRLSAPYIGALFVTRPIPIDGGTGYKACIWGCNDPLNPLTQTAAQLFLKIEVDFFSDDGKTEVGESQYMLHPLPGAKDHRILSTEWRSMGIYFHTPNGAKTMTLSFRCDSSAEKGAITGALYLDDFTVETDPPGNAQSTPSPSPGKPNHLPAAH